MAHTFPDCVGEVDVVSDAENIKKLLKIPYSTNTVSSFLFTICFYWLLYFTVIKINNSEL